MFFGIEDIAIVVILIGGDTGGEAFQTAIKAEHSTRPEKGRKLSIHHQTSYSFIHKEIENTKQNKSLFCFYLYITM